ncbi:S8 family serine peptidase [Bacillus sp. DNRA2]|uniref:S8 family serine peptidase n=1 Tax=Bacillus sp. DNRA2 TaxID=2723053 RepID=UPI00145F01C8|nr:S8 family serine peptidase [Bacillus sp. DNRA2]NMD70073.1 S8 family serine peptidase [Bacillus sp. DNRA2]
MRILLSVFILFMIVNSALHQTYARIEVKTHPSIHIQTNINTSEAPTARLIHPPIPTENPQTEKIAIVTLENPQQPAEILKDFPELKLRYVFEHALTGFSVEGPMKALEQLAKKQSNIINISPVSTYEIEATRISPVSTYEIETIGPSRITAYEALGTLDTHNSSNLDIIDANKANRLLDEQGNYLTGKGVTVGVIDTGVDYTHPDLKANYKGGQDFVDGDKDPMETKGIAGRSTIHGTHVAGIIAANGKIKGVAPEANIIAYRALGPGGSGTTEQVIAAIEQAIKDKVDILNLSLGNSVNGPDLPISQALNKAVEAGITSVTSSGNSGPNRWTVGSPGTATKAISVGASTPKQRIPYLEILPNESSRAKTGNQSVRESESDSESQSQSEPLPTKVRLEPLQGSSAWTQDNRTAELIFGGLGRTDELKQAQGKIVILERGKLTFTQKAKNAARAGAKAVIIFNNTKGSFMGNLEEKLNIPVMSASQKDGRTLKKLCPLSVRTLLIEETDHLAEFSSRGPVTSSWEIKPDVVAPGVAINSTIPGGYLELQGTSMAAPHVAGAAALIKQAHPDWPPEQIKAALMNTAKPIKNQTGKNYQTYEQGAGRIQPIRAIRAKSIITPGSLQFGKFNLQEYHHRHQTSLTVTNTADHKQSYHFKMPKQIPGINWSLPLSFELTPGEAKQIQISMTIDPKHFAEKIYDGYLELHDETDIIRIPYLYVFEEPDYPRVMGFEIGVGDAEDNYRYEVYLPGGAEEFGIAIFNPETLEFIGYLDWARNVPNGLLEKEISREHLPQEGLYLAKVFAKKGGKEDRLETMIKIMPKSEESRFQ